MTLTQLFKAEGSQHCSPLFPHPRCSSQRGMRKRGQAMTVSKPLYVTRKEAAAMLSCSDQTISKLNKSGKLPFYYLGRYAVRIRISDLEAMLLQSTRHQEGA